MKLTYRGVEYNYTPVDVETAGSEVIGKYRGAVCRRSRLANIPVVQPVYHLKYRGCSYTTGTATPTQAPVSSQPAVPSPANPASTAPTVDETLAAAVTSTAKMSVRKLLEVNEVHQHFIHENLKHRLDVAKQQGNQTLIELLEQERQQVA